MDWMDLVFEILWRAGISFVTLLAVASLAMKLIKGIVESVDPIVTTFRKWVSRDE